MPSNTTPPTKKNKGGRPTSFNPELGDRIVTKMAEGDSLRTICSKPNTPSTSTVLRWMSIDTTGPQKDEPTNDHHQHDHRERHNWPEGLDQFQRQYARAREASADAAYEEIREVERGMRLPKTRVNPLFIAGKEEQMIALGIMAYEVNPDYIDPQTGRVLVESIKWRASKLKPKVYGERLELDHTGTVGVTVTALDHAPDYIKDQLKNAPKPALEPPTIDHEPDPGEDGTRH